MSPVAAIYEHAWIGTLPDGIAAPTLSVADNGDDTGATATVSGSLDSATNTILTQPIAELASGDWTNSGSRTGDGTVALSLAAGHYHAIAETTNDLYSNVSPAVYFVVTTGAEAVERAILTAVQARIRVLALDGLANDSVIIRKVLAKRFWTAEGVVLPAAIITPGRQSQPPAAGNVNQDDVSYRVLVTLLRADKQEPTGKLNLGAHELWVQKIAMAFRNRPLTAVSTVFTCAVSAALTVHEGAWYNNQLAGQIELTFTSREGRGLS